MNNLYLVSSSNFDIIFNCSGSDSIKTIAISNDDPKPKTTKKSAWTQNPESPVTFEENDPINADNDQNFSTISNEVEM